MGSPLTVVMSEIWVHDLEQTALLTSPDPPHNWRHFVDDGQGSFHDETHADQFLTFINSLSPDLKYTLEKPQNGYIGYLDIQIHPNNTLSVYRKPTHTNNYLKASSSSSNSSKDSVIRSLTQRALNICSPEHLDKELKHVRITCLENGHPLRRVDNLMNKTKINYNNPTRLTKQKNTIGFTSLPYIDKVLSPSLRTTLSRYNMETCYSSSPTLGNILTKTKTPTPAHTTRNVIYSIPCKDCPATYIGQTYRPLIKRIKEHEAQYRLQPSIVSSAPAKHALDNNHHMDYNSTEILSTTSKRQHLDCTERLAIDYHKPSLNGNIGPDISPIWLGLTTSLHFKPRPSDITQFN